MPAERQYYDSPYVAHPPLRPFVSNASCHTQEPSGGASGQASDVAIHAKEILRVREALTGIYQKHCAKPDESEAEGLARFGECSRTLSRRLMLIYFVERALERDYFMTGTFSGVKGAMHIANLLSS